MKLVQPRSLLEIILFQKTLQKTYNFLKRDSLPIDDGNDVIWLLYKYLFYQFQVIIGYKCQSNQIINSIFNKVIKTKIKFFIRNFGYNIDNT